MPDKYYIEAWNHIELIFDMQLFKDVCPLSYWNKYNQIMLKIYQKYTYT